MASASGVRAGGAYVELFTSAAGLEKGLKQAEARVRQFGSSISSVGKKLGGLGLGLEAPLLAAGKAFADNGSALNDMSERTGVSVEALSALGFAANQSGTDLGAVETGLRKMAKALQAGSEENLQAESTFAALGLSVHELMSSSPEDQFNAIADAIKGISNPTAKAAAAMQIFGKAGTSLLPMINELPELTEEAERLGLVMSTEDAKAADKLGDAMDAAKASMSRVLEVIGSALAPLLMDVAESMIGAIKSTVQWISANKPLIVTVFKVGAGIAAAGAAFVALGLTISGLAAVFGAIASAISFVGAGLAVLASPVVVIAAGLGLLAYKFLNVGEAGGKAMEFLKGQFGRLLVDAQTTFKGIADALKAGDIGLAAKILWAGLKVEWLNGVNFIKGVWADWGGAAMDVFTNVKAGVVSFIAGFTSDFERGFVVASGALYDAFVYVIGQIKGAWTAFSNFLMNNIDAFVANTSVELANMIKEIKTQVAVAKGFVTAGYAGGAKEILEINKENAKVVDEIRAKQEERKSGRAQTQEAQSQQAGQETAANTEARNKRLQSIDANRAGTQGVIESDRKAEIDARRKASQEGLAAAAGELEAAKKSLADLTGQAAAKAAGVGGLTDTSQEGGGDGEGGLSPEGLDKSLDKAKKKVDVSGSFSASAFAGLGAGTSIQEEQVKESKKTNDHLEKLTKTVEKKKAIYA